MAPVEIGVMLDHSHRICWANSDLSPETITGSDLTRLDGGYDQHKNKTSMVIRALHPV